MTNHYKTRAIVFKKNNLNESDRNFSVFTDNFGRLDIFAKAIRKNASKLRGGMDVFFMSEIEFIQGKNRKTLTDAVKIKKFDNIFDNLEKFKIANKIGEILESFIKGEEKDEDIFNLLQDSFSRLNDRDTKTGKYSSIYYYFLWNALSMLGYHPEVQKCNICRGEINPDDVYFSARLGGATCKNCSVKDKFSQKINSDVVKILRIILKKDWQTLSRLKVESASQKILAEISENAIKSFCPEHC